MTKNKNPVRNREKDRNFAGLYAVTNYEEMTGRSGGKRKKKQEPDF